MGGRGLLVAVADHRGVLGGVIYRLLLHAGPPILLPQFSFSLGLGFRTHVGN